jgi:hypothetical protein
MGKVMKDSKEAFAAAHLLALQATEMVRGQMPALGGRGFNSSKRGRPATAPGLTRRFVLVPKLLISFPEIKHSNGGPVDFGREFNASQPGHLRIRRFIFWTCWGRKLLKIVAKFPPGGQP